MARTSLKVQDKQMVFMTVPEEDGLLIDVMEADENFVPIGDPMQCKLPLTEEQYHRSLRKEAKLRDQYVPEQSTNPEWNEDLPELKT